MKSPVLCFGCSREVRYPVLYPIPESVDVDERWVDDVVRYCSGCEAYREVKGIDVAAHEMFSLLGVVDDDSDDDEDETNEDERLEELTPNVPSPPEWYGK